MDISIATARVAPELLKALAILSDTTVRRSAVDREDLKPYWKSEKKPQFSRKALYRQRILEKINVRHPMIVLHLFSIKNIFYDKMDLRLFYFDVAPLPNMFFCIFQTKEAASNTVLVSFHSARTQKFPKTLEFLPPDTRA